jgi:hypothetical protein
MAMNDVHILKEKASYIIKPSFLLSGKAKYEKYKYQQTSFLLLFEAMICNAMHVDII